MARILHALSQRPMLTGSGVTLDAIARHAARAGHQQAAVIGVPADDPHAAVGELAEQAIHPLIFGAGEIGFAVPGMSDVMPYPSTRFSAMTEAQLATYRAAWSRHLTAVIAAFEPDLIHSHHVWLVSALVKDIAPDIPVVTHCHATGLRQMILCPHLAERVRQGCRRNERFVVLHGDHRANLAQALDIDPDRISVVGAGFASEVFHHRDRAATAGPGVRLAYAGKFSHAKGLPWLLDAVEACPDDVVLHVAGGGAGGEADALRARMDAMPRVTVHGQLDQRALADLLRHTDVFVLPSFYEGLPLVLAEALACGNRLIATRLPGIEAEMMPRFGDLMTVIEPPRLRDADQPIEADLPRFVTELRDAIAHARHAAPATAAPARLQAALAPFTWSGVFGRIEAVWRSMLLDGGVA